MRKRNFNLTICIFQGIPYAILREEILKVWNSRKFFTFLLVLIIWVSLFLRWRMICVKRKREEMSLMFNVMFWLYLVLIVTSWQITNKYFVTTYWWCGKANVVCMQFSELWYCVLGAARRESVNTVCLLSAACCLATSYWALTVHWAGYLSDQQTMMGGLDSLKDRILYLL